MKKMLTLLAAGLSMVFAANAKTFDDKTNLDQLTYRTLEPGQIAWNEEDGSAVIYIGSPSETKNLRVVDPAALRGYRYKEISSELTFNCEGMTMLADGVFKYIHDPAKPKLTDYQEVTKQEEVKKNDHGQFIHRYATFDPNTGTYTEVTLPEGFIIDPATQSETYYHIVQYWPCRVTIFSKDSIIEELDYTYTQVPGGLGDMDPIDTSRTITYDGRKAVLDIKVTHCTAKGNWCQVANFTAKCKGIGDVGNFVNDVTKEGGWTVKIKDREGTYNLSNLRYELYHKYDGNRGEDWAKYGAKENIHVRDHFILFSNTNEHTRSAIGASGKSFVFQHCENNYIKYISGDNEGTSPYSGTECRFTAINHPEPGSHVWALDFILSKPVPANFIEVEYVDDLLKAQAFWEPCEVILTDVGGDQMNYRAEVYENYGLRDKGFWRIRLTYAALQNILDIRATVRVLGENGTMYRLTFPESGGTVTAVRDN